MIISRRRAAPDRTPCTTAAESDGFHTLGVSRMFLDGSEPGANSPIPGALDVVRVNGCRLAVD